MDLIKHNLPEPSGIIHCDVVADIGCGIRPMNWYKPERHILVEPYAEYRRVLKENLPDAEIVGATALEYLSTLKEPVEAIYMLDVIEHMHKAMGWEVIALALEKASRQVVIFTPKGFMQQDEDNWGLGGHKWQTHRSGWLPGDFPGWQHSWYSRAFFAVWTTGQ